MYQGGGLLRDQRGWRPGAVRAICKIRLWGGVGSVKMQTAEAVLLGSYYGNIYDRTDI